jgi:hypothetical protein
LVGLAELPIAFSNYSLAVIGSLAIVFDLANQAIIDPQLCDFPVIGGH